MRLFRRTRQPSQRPCGCSPPAYCTQGQQILTMVERGERIAGQYGTWTDYSQAVAELAIHLGREPSTVRAMLRHPAGTL